MPARITVFTEQAVREARELSTPERVKIAEAAAATARATAPVDTGEFRDGIGVEQSGDRVALVNNDPEAFYKEYGVAARPAHATMTDSARQYGKYTGMQPRGRRTR